MTQRITYPRDNWAESMGVYERGISEIKKFPPYVYSAYRGALIHEVARLEARWWDIEWHELVRLENPRLLAHTKCGMFFYLDAKRGNMCELPKPDAVLCGRCQGKERTFSRKKKHDVTFREARKRVGCVARR